MSLLDNITEKIVDTSVIAKNASAVVDNFQWHLTLNLPFKYTYDKSEEVIELGYEISSKLENLRCVTQCDIVRVNLNTSEHIEDVILSSGIILRSTSGQGFDLPGIVFGLEIVRGSSLRSLFRLLHLIAYYQNCICKEYEHRQKANIEYNGDDGRYGQEIRRECIESWLERNFTTEEYDIRSTTQFVLECLHYDKYTSVRYSELYYPRIAFEYENFHDLAIMRRHVKGEYTLPMVISSKPYAVLMIHASELSVLYFKYYTMACIISSLSDKLKMYGTTLDKDPRYAQRLRLVGDYLFLKAGVRPEQILNFQKVYDTASLIEKDFPLEDKRKYTSEYLYKIANYINDTIKGVY